jgi:hypothetical protein
MSREMSEAIKKGKEVGPGVLYIQPEDVDPEMVRTRDIVRARARRQLERDGIERVREVNRATPMHYAMSSVDLPGEAVAMIVRDPAARYGRLIIFSEQNVDDAALVMADVALERDERDHPKVGNRRVLFVTRDQRVKTDRGADEGTLGLQHSFSGQRILVSQLIQATKNAAALEVDVDGVGPVKVIVGVE